MKETNHLKQYDTTSFHKYKFKINNNKTYPTKLITVKFQFSMDQMQPK